MTIREAFAKAGHPKPGAYLLRERNPGNESHWFSSDDMFMDDEQMFSLTLGRWVSARLVVALDWKRDYSDEPAKPFYDALPEVVQKVVKP